MENLNFISTIRSTDTANFQTELSAEPSIKEKRYYMEILAAQVKFPNSQAYQFTPESMPYMVAGYKEGLTLFVNHYKEKNAVGFGETTDAIFDGTSLIVQAYISRGKKTPEGPFGDTDELIDAVEEGFLKDASVGIIPEKISCSICSKPGPLSPLSLLFGDVDPTGCQHIRGEKYQIKSETGMVTEQIAIALIEKSIPLELSLAWDGADDLARVINRNADVVNYSNPLSNLTAAQHAQILNFTRYNNSTGFSFPTFTEGGSDMTPEQIAAIKAEKEAAEAKAAAKDTEIAALKQSSEAFQTQLAEKDTKIAELEAQLADSAAQIADGETAREKAIESGVEAFTKANPDMKQEELTAAIEKHKEFLNTLSLEQMLANTAGYESFAQKLYPEGRKTKDGGEADKLPQRKRVRKVAR